MFLPAALTVTFVARGQIQLTHALTWTDAAVTITVPRGFVSDGASIPPIAWPIVGHPYSGSILRSAVLHDYEIVTRDAPSREVHRRFYRTLRATGNGRVRAGILFLGVLLGGPRW